MFHLTKKLIPAILRENRKKEVWMKKIVFMFFLLIFFGYLQSSSSSSLILAKNKIRNNIDWVDSLNMNLTGMWNFGYPFAVYAKDNYLYLGSGGSVVIFDISDTTNPQQIADISFPGSFVQGIYIRATLMFVADGEKGLRIVDISDPLYPLEIGAYDGPWVQGVFAKNNLVYATENTDNFHLAIYSVSDPQSPYILGQCILPTASAPEIIVSGEYAYVANESGGLRILNVSDSTNPFEVSHLIPPGDVYSLSIYCDSFLLLSTKSCIGNGGLWVVNIKNPYNPYTIGCDTSLFWGGRDVSYFSHFAYVSTGFEGIKIMDILDPTSPYIIGDFLPPCFLLNHTHTNIGAYIYAGEWGTKEGLGNALRTIDASNPSLPVSIDYDAIPDRSIDVALQGNYAYVANFYSGIYTLDVSNPSSPHEVSHYDTKGRSNSIVIKDSIAYIADSASILLLNISNPYNPVRICELPLICDGYGLELNYPYLYVTSEGQHYFAIVNVSNPNNPFVTGICNLDPYYPTYICYKDSFAFVSASYNLAVINIADVYNPTLLTYLPFPGYGYARGIAYQGDYLYVADFENNAVNIVDISNPTTPVLIDTFHTIMHAPFALTISDSLLYIALQLYGIEVFDIASPLSPQSVGHYCGSPLSTPLGITFANGFAYLAADNGIYIFQYTGSTGKKEELVGNKSNTNISFKCYPSTFSKKVSIEINTEKKDSIKLQIYDIAGRKIKDIFTGKIKGKRLFFWYGLNNEGRKVSSGIYFLEIESRRGNYHKKLVFIGK